MAFHQVHGVGPIGQAAERGAHGDFLGDTGGLDHAQMVVACAHAGDDRMDRGPSVAGQTLALDDDHAPAFAEDHPVSFGIEGAGGFVRRPRPSRQPVKSTQGGEFQEMQMCEILLAPADDGGVDDAVADHLQGAVKRDQGGGAGGGDRIAGPHDAVAVADEAGGGAVESAQKRGVVRGYATGLHLPFDSALLIRGEGNGPLDGGKDFVHVLPDNHIGEGARRLSGVLGDEDRDALARDT
jgi:hypothetical protein